MIPPNHLLPRHCLALLALVPLFARAQSADPAFADETVRLTPFSVTPDQNGRYESASSTSGGRVRTEIANTPASITVLTSELFQDIDMANVVDGAKYSAGITVSTIPNGLDRITVRGFQTDGTTINGFYNLGQSNLDPAIIDRMEIVKGPNLVLSPTGNPGGTINIVTKTPQYQFGGSVTAQVGLFDANRLELDLTGPVSFAPNVAYRLIAAAQDSRGWWKGETTKSFMLAPSLTFRLGANTEVTFNGEYYKWKGGNYFGVPVDPSAGTNTTANIFAGIPRDASYNVGGEYRKDDIESVTAFLTSKLSDDLSMRLAGRVMSEVPIFNTINPSVSTAGGAVNPLTGVYVPGFIFGPAPTFAPLPAAQPSNLLTFAGTYNQQNYTYLDLNNDYVYAKSFGGVTNTTTAGFSLNYFRTLFNTHNLSHAPENIFAPDQSLPIFATSGRTSAADDQQIVFESYLNEQLAFFKNRLIFNGGLAGFWFRQNRLDNLVLDPIQPGGVTALQGYKTPVQYGVVGKPLEFISIYFSHNENAAPILMANNLGFVDMRITPKFNSAKQNEYGAKFRFLNDKLTLSAAHYEIVQSGYAIPNPGNQAVPVPVPLLPNIFTSRENRGWEFEANTQLTPELSLLGNYTFYTNRDPNNIPFRGAAEKSGAVWARYQFTKLHLKELALGLGADYVAKRPGVVASGITAASTPANVIAVQPSFYLPARTLVNASLIYTRRTWVVRLACDNLLDADYLEASSNRNEVMTGTPINLKASFTYKFY